MAQLKQLFSRQHWRIGQLGLITCLALTIALWHTPSMAQSARITTAKIVEIREGNQVFIQNRQARVGDDGRLGQQVRTARSRAGLQFNVRAGVRLGLNSSMLVGDECIRLYKGQVLITGSTGKLGCVGDIRARPVGTVYIMEIDDNNQGRIIVLDGQVEVFNEQTPNVKPVTVAAGQGVDISPAGTVSNAQTLSQSQLQTAAAPVIEGFQVPLPGLDAIAALFQKPGFTSTFLRDALTGGDSSFANFDGLKPQRPNNDYPVGETVTGIFVRSGPAGQRSGNAGTFTPSTAFTPIVGGPTIPAGTSIPFTIDFNAQTINFNSVPLQTVTSSLGLSGSGASGTAVYPGGQGIRIQVFDVGVGKEPINGVPYSGSITTGIVRDR